MELSVEVNDVDPVDDAAVDEFSFVGLVTSDVVVVDPAVVVFEVEALEVGIALEDSVGFVELEALVDAEVDEFPFVGLVTSDVVVVDPTVVTFEVEALEVGFAVDDSVEFIDAGAAVAGFVGFVTVELVVETVVSEVVDMVWFVGLIVVLVCSIIWGAHAA